VDGADVRDGGRAVDVPAVDGAAAVQVTVARVPSGASAVARVEVRGRGGRRWAALAGRVRVSLE
jgi:hypothetical protein